MFNRLFIVLTCFRLILPLQAIAQGDPGVVPKAQQEISSLREITLKEFQSQPGDSLTVDLKRSTGYLISASGDYYTSFPVLSGQKRTVYYLGRTYFAATPEKTWETREKSVKGDRITFGPTGEFFRLFDGEKRTSYGIHSHKYWQLMKDRGNPYVSYGCVLVQDEVLDAIERSFLANGGRLAVTTTSATPSNA